jgi:hypothetical protein
MTRWREGSGSLKYSKHLTGEVKLTTDLAQLRLVLDIPERIALVFLVFSPKGHRA